MSRKKTPDNLTLCAIAASNAGMTYGKYMAKCGQYAGKAAGQSHSAPQLELLEGMRACRVCGSPFYVTFYLRKFCSNECRNKWEKQRKRESYKKRRV